MTLSPLDRDCILDSLRAGCTLAAACSAVGIAPADVYALSADPSDEGRAWAAAINAAIDEGARPRAQAKRIEVRKASPPATDGDRWAIVHREAAELAPGPMGYLLWTDIRCASIGSPPISEWWKFSISEFYDSGKTWGVFCGGRGMGKSTTLERVAGSDSLFTPRNIYPGQTWEWPFISVGPNDANRRIQGLTSVLRAMGIPIIGEMDDDGEKTKTGAKLVERPRGSLTLLDSRENKIQLLSIAGTVSNVSGPSTIGMTIDEGAKLNDKDTHVNPLTEIVGSVAQTSRSRVGWRAILSSSPWDRTGTFWAMVEQGDTITNYVARIGDKFLRIALEGFESVAQWEESGADGHRPSPSNAAIIREYMRTLTAQSPSVPTWVGHQGYGNPLCVPWDRAAIETRKLVEVLPEKALGGVPRITFWLRENGAVPMGHGGRNSGAAEQIRGIAAWQEKERQRAEYGGGLREMGDERWIGKL